ncbi:hypothetical protein SHIRM173S_04713 [Streptomyces hirsutus]
MYLVWLQGQGTSSWPGSRGAPTECTALTKKPSSPSSSRTSWPIRVMVRMETATYAESVISTPIADSGEPRGPMQKGTTYIVRPFMEPRKTPFSPVKISRISPGAFQWLVGPASSSFSEQMKVRSSTRATSLGSEAA